MAVVGLEQVGGLGEGEGPGGELGVPALLEVQQGQVHQVHVVGLHGLAQRQLALAHAQQQRHAVRRPRLAVLGLVVDGGGGGGGGGCVFPLSLPIVIFRHICFLLTVWYEVGV